MVENVSFHFKQMWTQISSLLFTGCIIWSKLFNLSVPQFPQLRNGIMRISPHRLMKIKLDEVLVQGLLTGQTHRGELYYSSISCYLGLVSTAK